MSKAQYWVVQLETLAYVCQAHHILPYILTQALNLIPSCCTLPCAFIVTPPHPSGKIQPHLCSPGHCFFLLPLPSALLQSFLGKKNVPTNPPDPLLSPQPNSACFQVPDHMFTMSTLHRRHPLLCHFRRAASCMYSLQLP